MRNKYAERLIIFQVVFTSSVVIGFLHNVDWLKALAIILVWLLIVPITMFNIGFVDHIALTVDLNNKDRVNYVSRLLYQGSFILSIVIFIQYGRPYEAGSLVIFLITMLGTKTYAKHTHNLKR